jgi:hypothetical protein
MNRHDPRLVWTGTFSNMSFMSPWLVIAGMDSHRSSIPEHIEEDALCRPAHDHLIQNV